MKRSAFLTLIAAVAALGISTASAADETKAIAVLSSASGAR
jgi:hypothetical protein